MEVHQEADLETTDCTAAAAAVNRSVPISILKNLWTEYTVDLQLQIVRHA